MNGKDRLNRLDLDDHAIIDQHIDSVPELDRDAIVLNGKDLLAFDCDAHPAKFVGQTFTIGPFEQTGAQSGVHAVSGTQDGMCCFAVYQL